jgi:hypothetical protein
MALNVEWLRALVLCAVMLVSFGVYLAPLATPAVAFVFVFGLVVCASPHFQFVTVAGGLCRTVSHSPFVKLGNSALATYPNNLSGKSSWVIGRASSTHVSVCSTCTVQSRTRPWSYSVVIIVLVLSNPLKDGNADGY